MFKVVMLVGLALLSGCANAPYRQTARLWDSLSEQASQCFNNLENDRDLASIANKVMLVHSFEYAKDPQQEFTNINDLPNPEERKVIRKWAAKLDVCYKIKAAHYVYESPRVARVSIESDAEQQLLVTELYKGNLSFGQFAVKRDQIDSRRSSRFIRAVTTDIKEYEASQLQHPGGPGASPSSSDSLCGYEGANGSYSWVCREKSD